jgi:hypothetical protein
LDFGIGKEEEDEEAWSGPAAIYSIDQFNG